MGFEHCVILGKEFVLMFVEVMALVEIASVLAKFGYLSTLKG